MQKGARKKHAHTQVVISEMWNEKCSYFATTTKWHKCANCNDDDDDEAQHKCGVRANFMMCPLQCTKYLSLSSHTYSCSKEAEFVELIIN